MKQKAKFERACGGYVFTGGLVGRTNDISGNTLRCIHDCIPCREGLPRSPTPKLPLLGRVGLFLGLRPCRRCSRRCRVIQGRTSGHRVDGRRLLQRLSLILTARSSAHHPKTVWVDACCGPRRRSLRSWTFLGELHPETSFWGCLRLHSIAPATVICEGKLETCLPVRRN